MKYAGAVYEARTHGSVRGMRWRRLTLLDYIKKLLYGSVFGAI